MRFQISMVALLAAVSIQSSAVSATNLLSVAFGTSVPKDGTGLTLVEKSGPSRANGGEHFTVKFNAAKLISDIKLTAYSGAHSGKTLIHSATGTDGATVVPLEGLSQFAKVTAGNPVNYQNLVMLPDTAFVEVSPNQAFSQLDIVVEGFTNDDVSLLLQVTSTDGLPVESFLVTRTGPSGETVGAMINEAKFAKFTAEQLKSLMTGSEQPALADLAGKTFVCSSYSKLNAAQIDFKTRTYVSPAAGVLQSSSDLEGANINWKQTSVGWQMTVENFNGCGHYPTANVLRKTPGGNLISEVVLDLDGYLTLCENAGYDRAATQAVETNSTYPSVVDPKFVTDSYEFCHSK